MMKTSTLSKAVIYCISSCTGATLTLGLARGSKAGSSSAGTPMSLTSILNTVTSIIRPKSMVNAARLHREPESNIDRP